MPFSESLKKEVRKKAGFHCCACFQITMSIDVHHIKPEKENGTDEIENAAPLCPSCHRTIGGNKDLQKQLIEKRDYLYELVKSGVPFQKGPSLRDTETLYEQVQASKENDEKALDDLKDTLLKFRTFIDAKIEALDPSTAVGTATNIVRASSDVIPLSQLIPGVTITASTEQDFADGEAASSLTLGNFYTDTSPLTQSDETPTATILTPTGHINRNDPGEGEEQS